MARQKDPLIDEIRAVLRDRFGLDPENEIINFETLRREKDPEGFDRMRAEFEAALATSLNREEVLRRTYFGETFGIHLHSVFSKSEVEWIRPELRIHYPVCTAEEIRRIQNPTTAEDHLLMLRADAIADSPRLKKVFLSRREKSKENWSLTAHFERDDFNRYLNVLPPEKRATCRKVPAGMAFLREPNGACMRSEAGDIIVVSESLRHYLYYMNAFLFGQQTLQVDDYLATLMISVRTMLLKETLDFDIDPRGDLPSELDQHVSNLVDDQIQFVIGHEYAHLLLGHLKRKLLGAPPLGVVPFDVQERFQYYTPKQNQELAADAGALLDPQLSDLQVAERLFAATWFFLGLEIFYAIAECVDPSSRPAKTHPPPIERIWALRRTVLEVRTLDLEIIYSDEQLEHAIEWIEGLKEQLLGDFIPRNLKTLKMYGSVYIPSYRGAVLHDRIDY
ncbi:hypothetical protein GTP46_26880 [Duganella sp. FT135W]|uniref:Uncharacterized protein n=1 Tax=Duganella flavida TaxID=2692175 RepID=A0A6L8KGV0_9BURK|nr:hypothetical protein [Duganella flavida]MYM26260.1 hypothetical protein [Duganella flavida]